MTGSARATSRAEDAQSRRSNLKALVDNTALLDQLFASETAFSALHAKVAPMLQVPTSFTGLNDILGTLRQIGSIFGAIPKRMLPEYGSIVDWIARFDGTSRATAFWQAEVIASYGKRAQEKGSSGDSARFPYFQGIHDSHPVWCALFFMSGTPVGAPHADERARAYRAMQFWYLGAFIRLQAAGGLTKEIRTRVVEAGRLLRELHQPDLAEELDWFARVQLDNLHRAHTRLAKRHRGASEKGMRQGYGALADLVNLGWQLHLPSVFNLPKGLRGSRSRKARGPRIEYDLIFPDHRHFIYLLAQEAWLAEQDTCRASVQVVAAGADLADDLNDAGIAPDEFAADTVVRVKLADLDPRADSAPKDLPPLASLYAAARSRVRAQTMEDQRFTTRLDRITTADLARVLTVLDELFAHQVPVGLAVGANASESANLRETVLLLAISLVTGAPPEDVRTLAAATGTPPCVPEGGRLAYAPAECWWLRPYEAPDRESVTITGEITPVRTGPDIVLDDVWNLGRHLDPSPVRGWFLLSTAAAHQVFLTQVGPALVAAGVPRRWCRFEAFGEIMPGWFAGLEEGDHLRVAVLFGRSDRLAATHRYYTILNRGDLAGYYAKHLVAIWKATSANGFQPRTDLFQPRAVASVDNGYVGDDRVHDLQTMHTLANRLRERIILPADKSLAALARHHNARTAYLAFTLALVTGCRAVRTPIPNLRLIDRETGFLSLQEKDRKDGSHARIVWLPQRVRDLIDEYLTHLKTLWLEPTLRMSSLLKVAATKHRDRCRFDDASFDLSLLCTVWFFDTAEVEPRPVEWTGSVLKRHLDAAAPGHWLFDNAGRHVLRSTLTNRGIATTAINALLGHWHSTESAWAPESAFDPLRYRAEIGPLLDRLLNALGYEPTTSPQAVP